MDKPKNPVLASRSLLPRVLPLALASWASVLPAGAQERVLRECEAPCLIRAERVITFGEKTGPGYVGTPIGVVERSDGTWVLADREDQNRLKVFGADGSFLRSVGRAGDGPGEFRTINHLGLLDGDTIEVYDLGGLRIQRFGPRFEPGSITRVPEFHAASMARTTDGRRVVNAVVALPSGIGLPLHLLSEDGQILASFGSEPPIEDLRASHRRHFSLTPRETAWATPHTEYRLEEWSWEGRRLRTLVRNAPWLTRDGDLLLSPDGVPNPWVRAIREDREGRLWVVALVPGTDWESGVGPQEQFTGEVLTGINNMERAFDTIIEVIDPDSGRILGSQRLSMPVQGFVDDGRVYAVEITPIGDYRISVWELKLP
ncbi:MAG: 6-bladed beta-propeller [Gemmatimonadales bacterium]|nr:MAG: 6-bladed beta-propeller [Gemmatimonadales bacterium]